MYCVSGGSVHIQEPGTDSLFLVINHGRCYRNKATSRYLLGGKNGLDFIDPTSREPRHVPQGIRATCQLGVLPCNGLIYLPPHACTCEPDGR